MTSPGVTDQPLQLEQKLSHQKLQSNRRQQMTTKLSGQTSCSFGSAVTEHTSLLFWQSETQAARLL